MALLWRLLAIGVQLVAALVAIIGVTANGLGILERALILGAAALLVWTGVRLLRRPI